MIVKRTFSPGRVWSYIRGPMIYTIGWATASTALSVFLSIDSWHIGAMPIGILGSALAIFIAFRNNSSYARWWEARTAWGGIVTAARVLARLVVTFADSHANTPHYDRERSEEFKRRMIQLMHAWVHALRLQLRDEPLDPLQTRLDSRDFSMVAATPNAPTAIQMIMANHIYDAMGNGTLAGFDSFQIEGQLLALANHQGTVERIKHTPLPRQYDVFTRVFVLVFVTLLPLALQDTLPRDGWLPWLATLLSVIIGGVFIVMERTGAANEDPFEGAVTDVPMSALCRTIERDTLSILGKADLPPAAEAIHGYLM